MGAIGNGTDKATVKLTNELDYDHLSDIYRDRFESEQQKRLLIWQVLCKYWIQRYIPDNATVLDLAAGYCEFINQIECKHKIAVDLNEDTVHHAAPDVQVVMAYSHDMVGIKENSVDVVFVSNFFEHLPTKQAFLDTLREIKRVLKQGGKLLIMQPNIRFLHGSYWDFIDHYLPLTDRSLEEALRLVGMDVTEVRPRFMPYTMKGYLPAWPLLIRLYLALPFLHWTLGKQAWVVAVKR